VLSEGGEGVERRICLKKPHVSEYVSSIVRGLIQRECNLNKFTFHCSPMKEGKETAQEEREGVGGGEREIQIRGRI